MPCFLKRRTDVLGTGFLKVSGNTIVKHFQLPLPVNPATATVLLHSGIINPKDHVYGSTDNCHNNMFQRTREL